MLHLKMRLCRVQEPAMHALRTGACQVHQAHLRGMMGSHRHITPPLTIYEPITEQTHLLHACHRPWGTEGLQCRERAALRPDAFPVLLLHQASRASGCVDECYCLTAKLRPKRGLTDPFGLAASMLISGLNCEQTASYCSAGFSITTGRQMCHQPHDVHGVDPLAIPGLRNC